ncbi:hypothetical protein NLT11_003297 [Cronobacter sakazakii]|uniref:hypothetical protein n=1 Tax=Cronobacter sakazakii TaxID=28141 RepID=UPI000978203F|nr:hypothetical protein [Cronobacter sakazakii]EIZ2453371.1 hypothetical protein [Cronobacter sakazakii]EIZ2467233.1 hypothetical protein [Cronobacter sakazakii]EJJ0118077.1 hypothetical protein [Cronobacter sakazakii]EJK7741306.1 hypothetical protein [Cronobacter sakazakii]EKQ9977411.1 hypothetical protein [Cronobacter sakazakii]
MTRYGGFFIGENMRVHIVYRIGRYGNGYGVVAVFESKKDANAMVEKKTSCHEANSRYLYKVISKEVKSTNAA